MIRAVTVAIALAGLLVALLWLNSAPPGHRQYPSPWQGGGGTIP